MWAVPSFAQADSYPTAVQTRELSIAGAFEITPVVHRDDRGTFHEWFRADVLAPLVGPGFAVHSDTIAQANCSVSAAGTVRGIHFAQVPPGQAKYVTCLAGAVLDVVVDLRTSSPTYGAWDSVLLDDTDRRCVYVPEGLGHGFIALADGSLVSYLCSTGYDPAREHTISPVDPAIGIDWPTTDRDGRPLTPLLSDRDRDAPTLEQVRERGLLPG
jgi:dTDP-4-dehydrorhamnose 3,5-epimerase